MDQAPKAHVCHRRSDRHRGLHHPIPDGWDSEWSLAAACFRDPDSQKGLRSVLLRPKLLLQISEPRLHALGFDVLEALPVDAGRAAVCTAASPRFVEHV